MVERQEIEIVPAARLLLLPGVAQAAALPRILASADNPVRLWSPPPLVVCVR